MKLIEVRIKAIALIAVMFCFAGCELQDAKPRDKFLIVTTTGIIADAVRNVCGDKMEVVALMGPGVDPHLYKATHGDVEYITSADLIFYNGLHLEGKMGSIFEKASRTKKIIAVAEAIPTSELRSIEGFENTFDPHIWFDVELWKHAVKRISFSLKQLDTLNAQIYERNAAAYLSSLDSLHDAVKKSLASIPAQQRILITAHDAFGYFGDAYGIKVRGLQGISTISEFGLRDVTELVDFIADRKIKAIFIETSVSEKSINAVLEGCRRKGWDVKLGKSLYSDALGAPGTEAGTYIGMVDTNVRNIVASLK